MTEKELGIVKVSDEVIASVAGVAASQVKGVAGMSGGVVDGITKILSGSQIPKGVKINLTDRNVTIDISVIIEYNIFIPETARNIQENVKRAVENMTGLTVSEVNVFIQGVQIEKEENQKQRQF